MSRLRFALALSALVVAACGTLGPQSGTDVGNGATVALNLQGWVDPNRPQKQSLTLSDGARVDELYLVVVDARLQPGASCASSDQEVDVKGPLVADLLGGGIVSGRVTFPVTPGPFCRFHLAFAKLEKDQVPPGTPPALVGSSILMRGARADGVPFEVLADFGDEIELEAKNGSFVLPKGTSALILGFEIGSWMDALDLGTLAGNPIVVSPDVNKDRLDALHEVVKTSERLFKDQDDDGKLSAAEEASDNQLSQ